MSFYKIYKKDREFAIQIILKNISKIIKFVLKNSKFNKQLYKYGEYCKYIKFNSSKIYYYTYTFFIKLEDIFENKIGDFIYMYYRFNADIDTKEKIYDKFIISEKLISNINPFYANNTRFILFGIDINEY